MKTKGRIHRKPTSNCRGLQADGEVLALAEELRALGQGIAGLNFPQGVRDAVESALSKASDTRCIYLLCPWLANITGGRPVTLFSLAHYIAMYSNWADQLKWHPERFYAKFPRSKKWSVVKRKAMAEQFLKMRSELAIAEAVFDRGSRVSFDRSVLCHN